MACQILDIIFLDLRFESFGLVFVALILGFGSLLFSRTNRARHTRGRQGALADDIPRADRWRTPFQHRLKMALVFDIVFLCFLVALGFENGSQNRPNTHKEHFPNRSRF